MAVEGRGSPGERLVSEAMRATARGSALYIREGRQETKPAIRQQTDKAGARGADIGSERSSAEMRRKGRPAGDVQGEGSNNEMTALFLISAVWGAWR